MPGPNPAPRLLAIYLLATLVPLAASSLGPRTLLVGAAHVALAAVLLRSRPRGLDEPPGVVGWLPLLLVPALYAELPLLNQWAGAGYHDGLVRGWEAVLFPSDPSATWAGRVPWPWLSELLHAGYLSYYPLIYLPVVALHLRREWEALHRTVYALMLAFLICYVVFVFFPVQGPRYLNPAPPGVPEGPMRGLALTVLESGSSRGAAFPSSHVAVAATHAAMAVRTWGRPGWGLVPLAVLLACGAVYGGFHYAVDAVAGVGVAAAAVALAVRR